jgi:glucosamine-6-phosphate deaminase
VTARTPSVRVFAGGRHAVIAAAELLARTLRRPGECALALASGKTMVPIYRELAALHRLGRAPLRRGRTFNLDELRVAAEDPRSFRCFMERHLFSKVDLPREKIHFLRGDAPDAERECLRYERELARYGPPDLTLVGIGTNCHVAYLEPGRALPPRTALVRLSASTRRDLAAGGMKPVPREALTMGIETILSAREILLVATGKRKAGAIRAALEGPVSPACPASFLSLHPRLTVLLDRAAASSLASG